MTEQQSESGLDWIPELSDIDFDDLEPLTYGDDADIASAVVVEHDE